MQIMFFFSQIAFEEMKAMRKIEFHQVGRKRSATIWKKIKKASAIVSHVQLFYIFSSTRNEIWIHHKVSNSIHIFFLSLLFSFCLFLFFLILMLFYLFSFFFVMPFMLLLLLMPLGEHPAAIQSGNKIEIRLYFLILAFIALSTFTSSVLR